MSSKSYFVIRNREGAEQPGDRTYFSIKLFTRLLEKLRLPIDPALCQRDQSKDQMLVYEVPDAIVERLAEMDAASINMLSTELQTEDAPQHAIRDLIADLRTIADQARKTNRRLEFHFAGF